MRAARDAALAQVAELTKRVEELEDMVARLRAYKDQDDYEEAYEAIHDEAAKIAERRRG